MQRESEVQSCCNFKLLAGRSASETCELRSGRMIVQNSHYISLCANKWRKLLLPSRAVLHSVVIKSRDITCTSGVGGTEEKGTKKY